MIVKNTYGLSVGFSTSQYKVIPKNEFTGSSLQRKKQQKKIVKRKYPKQEEKLRIMSERTKKKIRKKITCFARCYKRLSFVTLTFLNAVGDEKAIILLRKFIDNAKKRSKDFQYVWVAERQMKNDVYKGNIHFHLITNKYWDIEKWWKYWVDLQKKNGITPRDENFMPTSAFDVKQLSSNNIRSISSYVTKYVTKNTEGFKCQVWNCSKRVSQLYTDFYTTEEFLENFDKLDAVAKTFIKKDNMNNKFLDVRLIKLNKNTLKLYKRLDDKNKAII